MKISKEEAEKQFRFEQLQQAQIFLEEGLKNGTIPERVYHKAQVAIARDYLLEHQRPFLAADTLRCCDAKYFKEEQRQDMAEDPMYAQVVIDLAQGLVAIGLVDTVPMPRFTQPLGQA